MSRLDVDNDPFLILLTDALRAGPGSPQWRDAVAQLRTSDRNVDEYRLLIEAREALESGRDWRSVRAGPGFTRQLMRDIETGRQSPAGPRFHPASWIALAAGIVIAAVIGIAVYALYPRPQADTGRREIDELASTYFSDEILSASFTGAIPDMWRTIGSLPLDASDGLRAGAATVPDGDYVGGGIVMNDSLPADQPFALQVSLRVNHPDSELIPQVFVSNDPDFSTDRAISSHELVWQLQGANQKVVVSGRVTYQGPIGERSPTHTIRFALKGDLAIVECDGRRLWAGRGDLGDRPRSIGVRFLRTGGKSAGDIRFESVRVLRTRS